MRRMWIVAIAALTSILPELSHAEEWAMAYNAKGRCTAYCMQETLDGGYVIAGRSEVAQDTYAVVLKLDSDGAVSWQKSYGIAYESASCIQQTYDGGYILAGLTLDFEGSETRDLWILQLDPDGEVLWQKSYDWGETDSASSIQQTFDGGFVVVGNTESPGSKSDALVLRLDSEGNDVWKKKYGGVEIDFASSIQQTADGGFVFAGSTVFFSGGIYNRDLWVVRLDSDGNVAWQKSYGGGGVDSAASILQTSDGGFVVAGSTGSFGAGSKDVWILKLNSDGTVNWQKAYGGNNTDSGYAIQQTSDGGYVVSGETGSFGAGFADSWVLKLDSDGTVAWQRTYGGTGSDWANSVHETADAGYAVAGPTTLFGALNNFCVLKLDSDGQIPSCRIMDTSNATVTDTEVTGQDAALPFQDTYVSPSDTSASAWDSSAQEWPVCPGIIVDTIVLRDLDNNVSTRELRPGTNTRYKVKFTVDGQPNRKYKVVVTGRAFSLYKPDGTNREWIDKFNGPNRRRRKCFGGESRQVFWDRQIPGFSTTDSRAKVKFTLRLKEYDQAGGIWRTLGSCQKGKAFNIIE